jgi:hypothetical protein
MQHLYREIVKFASRSWDLASLFVNGLLSYPGIYPELYIASHVIPGIYADWGTNSSRYTGRKSETAFDF